MTAALLIPVDGDIRKVDVTDDSIAATIGAPYFDLVTNVEHGYSIAVDDEGLLRRLAPNAAATTLAQTFGRAYDLPLVGDALVIGLGEDGATVDVPGVVRVLLEVDDG